MSSEPTPMDVDENIFDLKYKELIKVLQGLNIKSENMLKFLNIIRECKRTNNLYIKESDIDKILNRQQKKELTELYTFPFYYPSTQWSVSNQYMTYPSQTMESDMGFHSQTMESDMGFHSQTMEDVRRSPWQSVRKSPFCTSESTTLFTSPFKNTVESYDSPMTIESPEKSDTQECKDKIIRTLSGMSSQDRHKFLANMLLKKKLEQI
jgi:hypothetical protein